MSTFYPAGGGTYNLNSSIGSTDASFSLSSFTVPVSGVPITMSLMNTSIAFGTIGPRTSSSEFISFTGITQNADGTATLTGVTRGLQKTYPFTSSATFQLSHSGQSVFILSDVPQIFYEYPSKVNDEEIVGLWHFDQTPTGLNPGAVQDSSTTVKGIGKISVAPVSPTNPIFIGQNDPLVSPVSLATLTAGQVAALFGNNTDVAIGSGNKLVTQTGLIHGAEKYATTTGSTNAYVATLSPIPTSLTAGMTLTLIANFSNTGASTLAVNGLGSTPAITKYGTTALASGDIINGQAFTVTWDGTRWQLQNPVANQFMLGLFKNGTTTYNLATASGVQNIAHGLGVIPKFIKITAWINANAGGSPPVVLLQNSFGTYNGTTISCLFNQQNTSGQHLEGNISTSVIAFYGDSNSPQAVQAAVPTFDATNIILTWTKTNSPTGTLSILWEAYA